MKKFRKPRVAVAAVLSLLAASSLSPRDNAVGQDRVIKTYDGSKTTVRVMSYDEVPEATEVCTQEEKQWWDRFRKAGNALQLKRDKKSQTNFGLLFVEGLEKGYRIPLKDRAPQVLVFGRVVFPELILTRARIKGLKGSIDLSIEYRADGSVGDIKIVKGLDKEMDRYAVQAARQNIFIPAIKDGAFVTVWVSGGIRFST